MKPEKVSVECVFDALIDAIAHIVYLFLFEVSSVCLPQYLTVNVFIEATGLNYLCSLPPFWLSNLRSHDITPVSASLYWLPVCFRIKFNISLITFTERLGWAPTYITEMLNQLPVSDPQVGGGLVAVPKSEAEIQKVAEPSPSGPLRLWNELPDEISLKSTKLCNSSKKVAFALAF